MICEGSQNQVLMGAGGRVQLNFERVRSYTEVVDGMGMVVP